MIKNWNTSKFFSYVLGGICWFVLLGILKSTCILNIPLHIDGLWVKSVGDGLVKNLIGATAFRVKGYGCEDKFIFVAPYYANGVDDKPQIKSIASLIDLKSWKKLQSDTVSTTYIDDYHRYILSQNSDGVNMKVYTK